MRMIEASPTPRGWRVRVSDAVPVRDVPVLDDLGDAYARGREALAAWFRASAALPTALRLEMAKAVRGVGEVALGAAVLLAERCQAGPAQAQVLLVPAAVASVEAVGWALRERGLATEPEPRPRRLRRGLRAVADAVVALLAWAWHQLKHAGEAGRVEARDGELLVLHGETSTRTRHLLELVRCGWRPDAVLVVGRPGRALATVLREWAAETGTDWPATGRPGSPRAALAALPEGIARLRDFLRNVDRFPWVPPARDRIGIAYRLLQGAGHAAWWRVQPGSARTAVFGHTGLADTTALEEALQATGTQTVHAVHGLAEGLNFAGISDLAVWRCAADARAADASDGYRRNLAVVAARPEPAATAPGLLLLTNLAHPMQLLYRWRGVQPEIDVIGEAAARWPDRRPATWKPHPSFLALPAAQRQAVEAAAAAAGVARAADDASVDALVDAAGTVACTPSTVVVQVLLRGRVPVLLGDRRWISHTALSDWPEAGGGFDDLWNRLGPAGPLDPRQWAATGGAT